ncbi:hypothetical protein [Propionivibrio sp.]
MEAQRLFAEAKNYQLINCVANLVLQGRGKSADGKAILAFEI